MCCKSINLILEIISLLFILAGGIFTFRQWCVSLKYKRIEIIKPLIEKVRENSNIATILEVIDWNNGFFYDGRFHINWYTKCLKLQSMNNEELTTIIDNVLSIFSYVCYLRKRRILQKEDMYFFEYKISRLFNNEHIGNYLFSLYHWTSSINVKMSFFNLVQYGIKKKYLSKTFKFIDSKDYKCYLVINNKKSKRFLFRNF